MYGHNHTKEDKKTTANNALHVIVLNHKSSQAFFKPAQKIKSNKKVSVYFFVILSTFLFFHLFPCVVKTKTDICE